MESTHHEVRTQQPSLLTDIWCSLRDIKETLVQHRGVVGQVFIVEFVLAVVLLCTPIPTFTLRGADVVWFIALIGINVSSLILMFAVLRWQQLDHGNTSLWRAIGWVVRHPLPILSVCIVWGGVLLVSSIFLLLPALLVFVYTLFGLVIAVRGGVTGSAAMVRSIEMVRGRWWRTFTIVVCVLGGMFFVLALPFVLLVSALELGWVSVSAGGEAVLVGLLVMYALLYESIMVVAWTRLLTKLYDTYEQTTVPLSDTARTKLEVIVRTIAWVGWLLPLLGLLAGAWMVMHSPELFDRVVLFILTGV